MIALGLRGTAALAALMMIMGGLRAAHGCEPRMLEIIRLSDSATLAQLAAESFSLIWRHSVSLTDVRADYRIDPDGQILQIAERFEAHGPGMAHDGTGWRIEDGWMMIDLDRPVPHLILRSAPAHENRLIAGGQALDLTQWPATPLEIRAAACKEPR